MAAPIRMCFSVGFSLDFVNMQRFCILRRLRSSLKPLAIQRNYSSSESPDYRDRKEELDEEEINEIRNVSRLQTHVRKRLHGDVSEIDTAPEEFKTERWYQRKMYARYGESSGFNPSVAWPTKDELQEKKEYEDEFEPSLDTMLKNIEESKIAYLERKAKREAIVDKNMLKMSMWIEEYKAKSVKEKEELEKQRLKRAKQLEDIRKQLGTQLRPTDFRVRALLEEKEKAEKKAEIAQKKQEKQDRMRAKLKILSE